MTKLQEGGKRFRICGAGRNYWQQDIRKKERIFMMFKASLAVGMTAWLYYRSAVALAALIPMWVWYYRRLEKECIWKKQQDFLQQFKDMIQAVSAALGTGYSIENAVRESQKELRLLYDENTVVHRELHILIQKLKVQIPIEQAIEEMAYRVKLADVENFAAVFVTSKRSGGDLIRIIKNTSKQIADKIDVSREIETILAAKKYEFKIMAAIPYGMIAYLSVSFPGFMDRLYGNAFGTGVMTGCLILYMSAYYLGVKLIEIEV